jgi:hypothetical protein
MTSLVVSAYKGLRRFVSYLQRYATILMSTRPDSRYSVERMHERLQTFSRKQIISSKTCGPPQRQSYLDNHKVDLDAYLKHIRPTAGMLIQSLAMLSASTSAQASALPSSSNTAQPPASTAADATVDTTVDSTIDSTIEPTVEPTVEPIVEPTVETTVDTTAE